MSWSPSPQCPFQLRWLPPQFGNCEYSNLTAVPASFKASLTSAANLAPVSALHTERVDQDSYLCNANSVGVWQPDTGMPPFFPRIHQYPSGTGESWTAWSEYVSITVPLGCLPLYPWHSGALLGQRHCHLAPSSNRLTKRRRNRYNMLPKALVCQASQRSAPILFNFSNSGGVISCLSRSPLCCATSFLLIPCNT